MKTFKITGIGKCFARKSVVAWLGVIGFTLIGNVKAGEVANFTQTIPGSTVKFDMVAIPEGEITIGSPKSESGRDNNDMAQKKVKVKRFWMGKCEVTWDEFLPYVTIDPTNIVKGGKSLEGYIDKDGITHPTKPHGSIYRDRGEKGSNPAIGMGLPTAVNYAKWLSKKTGRHYRLPTEEEWEYACRAGSTTSYFWGNDATQAKGYAWFKDNAGEGTHLAGKLKPNKFGLYDIVGNVGEWCAKSDPKSPGVLRGGAWTEDATKLRSAARMIETEEWNDGDPNSPQSPWWLSSADFTGFRVVCDEEPVVADAGTPPSNITAKAGEPRSPDIKMDAKAVYMGKCKVCHGETGNGDTKFGKSHDARDYTSAAIKATYDEAKWIDSIKNGLEKDGKHLMSPFRDQLSDNEIKEVAQYMKNL